MLLGPAIALAADSGARFGHLPGASLHQRRTVHLLQSAAVCPGLKQFVRAYAQRTTTSADYCLVQPVPASLEHILEFEFRTPPRINYPNATSKSAYRISVVGSHTCPGIDLHLIGRVESFAIFFQPLGLWQLFRIPPGELVDNAYQGPDLVGPFAQELWDQLAERTSFQDRVAVTEKYLLRCAAAASGCTTIMKSAVHTFECRGRCSIQQLAQHSGLSLRHFERRFLNEIGMRPKLFARITRFQMALDQKLHSPCRSWLNISHELGYHDQMHMIRDFQGLGGATPERMLAELGDTRPPALAASERRSSHLP